MSEPERFPSLQAAEWLWRHAAEPDLHVLDASWHLPGSGRDARAEYHEAHIPGAAFFDIDHIADPDSDLPHMLPSAQRFAAEVGALGVGDASRVVIYDSHGLFGAARAWWMFRAFGHDRVAILDGGLARWRALGLPLEQGAPAPPQPATFTARPQPQRVRSLEQVRKGLEQRQIQLLDARPRGRFLGTDPEPRPGLPSGHIPGARNLPFQHLVDPTTHRLRGDDELVELFGGLDDRPVVCSCGTGVTACALAFGLHRLGRDDVAVYDGSWTEWAGRPELPLETGPGGPTEK